MDIINTEYQEHEVFAKLDKYIDFYEVMLNCANDLISSDEKSTIKMDALSFSSIGTSLERIRTALIQGHVNEAHLLLRKFYNIAFLNTWSIIYLEENKNRQDAIIQKIKSWFDDLETLPDYTSITINVKKAKKLSALNNLLFKKNDSVLLNDNAPLREKINIDTKCDYYNDVLSIDDPIYNCKRIEALNEISNNLTQLTITHFSYIFFLRQQYKSLAEDVGSSDSFIDPAIQEFFDENIKVYRPDIANFLQAQKI